MLLLLARLAWQRPWRGEPGPLGSLEGAFQEPAVQGVTNTRAAKGLGPGRAAGGLQGSALQGHCACCPWCPCPAPCQQQRDSFPFQGELFAADPRWIHR